MGDKYRFKWNLKVKILAFEEATTRNLSHSSCSWEDILQVERPCCPKEYGGNEGNSNPADAARWVLAVIHLICYFIHFLHFSTFIEFYFYYVIRFLSSPFFLFIYSWLLPFLSSFFHCIPDFPKTMQSDALLCLEMKSGASRNEQD